MKGLRSLFQKRNDKVKTTLSPFQVAELNKAVQAGTDSTAENVNFCNEMQKYGNGRCWTVFAKTNGYHCEEYYSKVINKSFCILEVEKENFRVGIEPWYLSRAFKSVETAKNWLTLVRLRNEVVKMGDLKLRKSESF